MSSAANPSAAASLPAASTTSTTPGMNSSSSHPLVSPFLAALLAGKPPSPLVPTNLHRGRGFDRLGRSPNRRLCERVVLRPAAADSSGADSGLRLVAVPTVAGLAPRGARGLTWLDAYARS
jgi:hypothetical protein